MADLTSPKSNSLRSIPSGVWALGFVSLFMDISSEMIHALLPVYMVTILGTSAMSVGLIEGIAEATASITKVFSGVVSDWLGKRKLLILLGYSLAAVAKPVFPLASSLSWLVAARFVDRVGKGIRGAPRDALIADITPPHIRGASFGLRQSLDTVGAFTGPILALVLMWWTSNAFTIVFWIAVLPAFISVAVVLFVVREPHRTPSRKPIRPPLTGRELARLPHAYWLVVAAASVFTLARFSEAFLLLDAERLGVPIMFIPVVLIAMNIVFAMSAFPVGVIADRFDRITLLATGLGLLFMADMAFALLPGFSGLIAGVLLWGLHMGFTQGLTATLVADTAPADMRGTAFGFFNLMIGVALLIASLLAGAMWDWWGPNATFLTGATCALCAGLLLAPLRHHLGRK